MTKILTNKHNKNIRLEVVMAAISKDTIHISRHPHSLIFRPTKPRHCTRPTSLVLIIRSNKQRDRTGVLCPITRNRKRMVHTTQLRDTNQDIITGVIGLHGFRARERHLDDIGVVVEGDGCLGVECTGLDDLGYESVDVVEHHVWEEVVPEDEVRVMDHCADKEDDGHVAVEPDEPGVVPSTDVWDREKRQNSQRALFNTSN